MDEVFGPAAISIYTGDLHALRRTLSADPDLVTRRSTVGHPTLLQLVACEADSIPDPVGAAAPLIDAGAEMAGPLLAAAGCNAPAVVELLIDRGATVDGTVPELPHWRPLDESLYWANGEMARYLADRGHPIGALRQAAGLGDVEALDRFFDGDELRSEAGPLGSPFPETVPPDLAADGPSIVDHAFVMAVNNGRRNTAEALLGRGAGINAKPPGYHWHGTALHVACWRGDADLVRWLLVAGADPSITDDMDGVGADAAGWARHHGHDNLLDLL